jgi:hypothetical protein
MMVIVDLYSAKMTRMSNWDVRQRDQFIAFCEKDYVRIDRRDNINEDIANNRDINTPAANTTREVHGW